MLSLSEVEQNLLSAGISLVAAVVGGGIGGWLGARREITTATRKRQQEVLIALAALLPDVDVVAWELVPETIDDDDVERVISQQRRLQERWESEWRESVSDQEVLKGVLLMQMDGRALKDYLELLKRVDRAPVAIESMTRAVGSYRESVGRLREYLDDRIRT